MLPGFNLIRWDSIALTTAEIFASLAFDSAPITRRTNPRMIMAEPRVSELPQENSTFRSMGFLLVKLVEPDPSRPLDEIPGEMAWVAAIPRVGEFIRDGNKTWVVQSIHHSRVRLDSFEQTFFQAFVIVEPFKP